MGCSISRAELRGRGKDPGLLSFRHNLDDVSGRDRTLLANNNQSLSEKLLIKQIVGRNNVSLERKDYVLGGSNDLLLPENLALKDPPSNEHTKPSLHDLHGHGATKRSSDSGQTENTRVEAVKLTKTNNHDGNDEELEERGAVIPKFNGPLWIASPSFRDYCNLVPDGASDEYDIAIPNGNNDPENRSNRENLTKDTDVTHDDADRSAKRRRNLRKVLTMHRPGRVRNLFSVATCYNPLTPSAQNGPRKPRGKTA